MKSLFQHNNMIQVIQKVKQTPIKIANARDNMLKLGFNLEAVMDLFV